MVVNQLEQTQASVTQFVEQQNGNGSNGNGGGAPGNGGTMDLDMELSRMGKGLGLDLFCDEAKDKDGEDSPPIPPAVRDGLIDENDPLFEVINSSYSHRLSIKDYFGAEVARVNGAIFVRGKNKYGEESLFGYRRSGKKHCGNTVYNHNICDDWVMELLYLLCQKFVGVPFKDNEFLEVAMEAVRVKPPVRKGGKPRKIKPHEIRVFLFFLRAHGLLPDAPKGGKKLLDTDIVAEVRAVWDKLQRHPPGGQKRAGRIKGIMYRKTRALGYNEPEGKPSDAPVPTPEDDSDE
jgi:hypothetical protein